MGKQGMWFRLSQGAAINFLLLREEEDTGRRTAA
jgi:hypothetical protein